MRQLLLENPILFTMLVSAATTAAWNLVRWVSKKTPTKVDDEIITWIEDAFSTKLTNDERQQVLDVVKKQLLKQLKK